MPSTRIILVVLACLIPLVARGQQVPGPGQFPVPEPIPTPSPAAVPEQQPAEARLDFATVQVREMKQIAAKVDMNVDMLNQKFGLEGNYYKDTGHRLRLQLNLIGLGDAKSKMLQVCDGKILWDFQQVLDMESYHKREIEPILKKLEDPNLDAGFRIAIISNMGFGGPEAMLTGLRKAVGFDYLSEEKLDGMDVVVLRGKWRDRSNLIGPGDRPLPPTADLPPYVPSNVAVYLGKLDGWPYKIEMIGKAPSMLLADTRAIDPATNRPIGRPMKAPNVDPTRVTLRYKLLPISEITPSLFTFEPPAKVAATVKDDTEEFLAGLDQYIQIEIQKKKAEAAKAEGEQPLLKAPIDVPSSPGGGAGTAPSAEGPSPK